MKEACLNMHFEDIFSKHQCSFRKSFNAEILGNVCIAIVCFPGCDVINFEMNLIFLIKPFFYMTEKSRQKFKYLENENSFQDEIKSIFHHF